jgi:hypothetical protein
MTRLIILTMALRPAGVLRAAESVAAAVATSPWPLEHRIVWHQGEPDPTRVRVAERVTQALAELPPDSWVFAVDDDNLLHPDLPRRLAEQLGRTPDALAVVFGQMHESVPACLRPTLPPTPGKIDGGQVAIRADYAALIPWKPGPMGDGAYLAALYARAPDHWAVCYQFDEPLSYHNAQVWL